jgi:hypothetical protein
MRGPVCGLSIDQERTSLYCRLGQRHKGDHAYWTINGRVEWDGTGMVLAQDGFPMWRPGRRYPVRPSDER